MSGKGASYGRHVDGERRNAASELIRVVYPTFGRLADAEPADLEEARQLFAKGFSREDRRRIIAVPTEGADGLLESFRAYWDLDQGAPTFVVPKIVAVRGDRLVLFVGRAEFATGQATESLVVVVFSSEMKVARSVLFDVEDLDGAVQELERLHAEVEADEGKTR